MNRDFLSNFEPPNIPQETESYEDTRMEAATEVEYEDDGQVRYVCFVWPDGKRKFHYYNRLDTGQINPDHDMIRLLFGTETVELVGMRLLPLFESFMKHQRKYVYCDDSRYNDLIEDEPVINEIIIGNS